MRLPDAAHTSRPWRIHEIAPDFQVEDVWALPTPGGPDDFPRLVELFIHSDPSRGAPGPARVLFAIRWKLGELFGWDSADASRASLRDRLPDDLRGTAVAAPAPFSPLFMAGDEWAAELANRTMHGVMHLGWVAGGAGGSRGQMTVLVKPNGRLGVAYMAAIKPFRHRIVYPQMLRTLERRWRSAGV
jgi:hypothetical protein